MDDQLKVKNQFFASKLIHLTQIGGHPRVNDGQPTPCAIDPNMIKTIKKGRSSWNKDALDLREGEALSYPTQECTLVGLQTGEQIPVTESVASVAQLRDKAVRAGD